ncbi:PC4-domain-containing protein [Bimuria novae-zelandiae CBS 107.79]|uniref:PC4-domain-containing protein n=1 Tax=Bimuria novae-zelandiae CBS 107.79 TaxID=1447943 RepID=A0A6A5VT96_9PLEO|nr:PC4-domain-containing protein [Bimuria novae-zelandiae CBS 107.79]
MYAKRGGSRGGSRGGFRGAGSGKKAFTKKRPSPDEDDEAEPASKKAKGDAEEEPLVPKLETDDENNPFVSLKANGMRRVTITEFKGNTLVNIREYWTDDGGQVKPGKKGISLTMEQYNTLLAAVPLIESVLTQRNEKTVRPNYDGEIAQPAKAEESAQDQDAEAKSEDDDEEEED